MTTFVQVNVDSPLAASRPVGYTIQESGCWEWQGAITSSGYGTWWVNKRLTPAHRVMYERHKGAIPEGLDLDHLCRNRKCVNPDHLEPVTRQENWRRGIAGQWQTIKTECPKGHPYNARNTRYTKQGWRVCRVCDAIRAARYRGQ